MEDSLVALVAVTTGLASLLGTTTGFYFARSGVKPTEAEQEKVDEEIVKALEVASSTPKSPELPMVLSDKGNAAAMAIMGSYTDDLVAEASRIARQAGAEAASDKHVQIAASRLGVLRSRVSGWADVLVTLGSLLVGVAVSYQVNIWTGGTPTPDSGLLMALAFGAGVGLAVSGWVVKLKKT